jgi:tetratricopeptide (TPR) repeat protein
MGNYPRASEHLRQWVEKGSPGNDQLIDVASFHWALLLTRSGHFFEALYLLGKKVEKHGPDPTLAEAMGLAWLRNLPEDYPPQKREIVWLAGMASAYLSDLKLDRVHEFQDQLVAHYGQEPNVHYFRGYVYEFEKRYDEAAEEYRQELKISPDSAVAMVQLALIDVENSQLDEARRREWSSILPTCRAGGIFRWRQKLRKFIACGSKWITTPMLPGLPKRCGDRDTVIAMCFTSPSVRESARQSSLMGASIMAALAPPPRAGT